MGAGAGGYGTANRSPGERGDETYPPEPALNSLRPAPYPLLFDQPEDDLDNRFIYNSLIKVVRELKCERQLIFVTHNANIPVLGEADRVIVMSMKDPSTANPALVGTVDERKREILDLLEGGKDAFRKRETRYQLLLREI